MERFILILPKLIAVIGVASPRLTDVVCIPLTLLGVKFAKKERYITDYLIRSVCWIKIITIDYYVKSIGGKKTKWM